MNFVGKFDAKLPVDGSIAHSQAHVEHSSTHAPADAIIVPDAHLLFGADFKRSGVDLILSNSDRELVLHDYFKGEHRLPLASPDGAHLTGDIVNALTGQVEYAQAADGTPAVAHVIGHVTKLAGSATAIRNGVSIILNQGDNVEKGDVVATGSDSTLGVTFIDGTVFGLSSNARMVLNEMVYDPNGSNNSSLISLVAGTISFVAGETAKHGDMKVDTPVATMGIRGTAVLVEIDFNVPGANGLPDAKFQVLVEPDGTTGSYILFDKTTLDPIATVNRAGQQVNINQNGISYTNSPLTPELQKLITDVFTQKFSATDTNTKLVEHFTDSIVPDAFHSFKGPDGIIVQAVFIQTNTLGNGPSQGLGPITSNPHIDLAPTVVTSNNGFTELHNVTGSHTPDTTGGVIKFVDINGGDQPTASTAFHSFSYQNAQHHEISQNLTPTEQAAVQAVEVALDVVQDPAAINFGTATWTYSVPDGAFDFLGAGETLTLTYLATVSNNFAQSIKTTTIPITITVVGTNDVPVITSSVPQTIAFDGGTSVAGGDLAAHVQTSGTINFDDPDLTDTHTVAVALTSTLTDPTTNTTSAFALPPTPLKLFTEALTASIGTDSTGTGLGTVNWNLADLPVWLGDFVPKGEVLNLTYAVTVTDSQGATSTQDITVAITGTDTPAVVWIATTGTGPAPDGLWSTGVNWETGNAPTASDDAIIITDQLEGLTPTYPVTITSAAVAHSLEMDNFGGAAPVLINQSTLDIGGAFTVNDHSTGNPVGYTGPEFDNHGTLTVGGAFDLSADAVLHNTGGILLGLGGTFGAGSTITNSSTGLIEVSGGTLGVNANIANSGQVAIDVGTALTLDGGAIDGGAAINRGTLTLDGNATVENGTLYNANQIDVSGSGNALINETIDNNSNIAFPALLYSLSLPPNPTLNEDPGPGGVTITAVNVSVPVYTMTVTGSLTLNGVTINGGLVTSTGSIDVTGDSAIDGAAVTGGQMTVESDTTLTLDGTGVWQTTITDNGTIKVDASDLLILSQAALTSGMTGGKIANFGEIEISANFAYAMGGASVFVASPEPPEPTSTTTTITGATIDNNTLVVDSGQTLKLNDSTVDGGIITNNGALSVDSGHVMTLEGGVAVKGGTLIDSGTVDIAGTGATFNNLDSTGSVDIEVGPPTSSTSTPITTLLLENGTALSNGTLTVGPAGALQIQTASGASTGEESITNKNSIEVFAGSDFYLGLSTLDNTAGIITIDATGQLELDDSSLNGGTVNYFTTDPNALVSDDILINRSSTISNAHLNGGAMKLLSDAALTLDGSTITGMTIDAVATGTTIQVDGGAANTLTLNDVFVFGGTINNFSTDASGHIIAGDIDVTGSSTIDSIALNKGNVTVGSNVTLTLDGITVTGTSFDDTASGATIRVDGNNTLTLNGVSINGGTIDAFTSSGGTTTIGNIDVTGSSTISNADLNNGNVTLGGNVTLNLDGTTATGTSFDDTASGATIQIDGGDTLTLNGVSINGGAINAFTSVPSGAAIAADIDVTGSSTISNAHLNNGDVTLSANVTLTLDGTTVTGSSFNDTASGATIQIDGNDTLTLNDASINGGTINAFTSVPSGAAIAADIEVTGSSTISNADLNNGNVTLGGNVTLNLDGTTATGTSFDDTASGATIQIDGGDTLTLNGAGINGGTINAFTSVPSGAAIAADIDVTGDSTISNAALNNGNVTLGNNVMLTLGNDIVTGANFADTASGATIQITGNTTLDDVTVSGGALTGATITIDGNETLQLQDGVTVSGLTIDNSGTLDIESSTGVTLNGVNVTGSGHTQVDIVAVPTAITPLILEGGTKFTDGTLTVGATSGALKIETAAGATLDHVGLTNDRTIEVANGGVLTLDGGTTVDNGGGTFTVDGGGRLTLNDASISGGTINDFDTGGAGTIDVTGDSTIDGGATLNNGNVTVETATLTLDDVTISGSTITEEVTSSVIQVDSGGLTLKGGAIIEGASGVTATIDNAGTIEIAGVAALHDVKLTNTATGSIIQVDDGKTLTLSGTEISGGTINDFDVHGAGIIDVTTDSKIDGNATLNEGNVTVETASLTLDNVTINGSTITEEFASGSVVQVDSGGLTLEGGAIIQGASGVTGTINNAGTIEIAGAATLHDEMLTNTGGNIVQVDDGKTLTLSSTEIVGGTVNDFDTHGAGTIDVTGDSKVDGGATLNNGNVTVETATLTLDNVTIDGTTITEEIASGSVIQVDSGGLTLEGGAIIQGASGVTGTINNAGTIELAGDTSLVDVKLTNTATGSLIQIDDGQTLTLNGATISGGTIDDNSTASGIVVTGASTIESATIDGSGAPGVGLGGMAGMGGAGGLVLAGSGDITVNNATLTLSEVTLDNVTLSDSAGGSFVNADTLTIADTVTLNGATINGGTIDDNSIASGIVVSGASTIKNATVNGSGASNSLGSGDITVNGTTLTLSEVTLDDVTLSDSAGGSFVNADTLTIDGTVTLNGATISGGTIDDNSIASGIVVTGASTIENATINGSAAGGVGGPGGFGGLGGTGGLVDITSGNIAVSGATLTVSEVTLDNVTLSDSAGGSFVNADTLTIDGTVTLNGATINNTATGAVIDDTGTLSVTVNSAIDGGTVDGGGALTASGAKLTLSEVTLDNVTLSDSAGGSFVNADTLTINGTVTLNGATINNTATNAIIDDTGTLSIAANSAIDGGTVDGGGALTASGAKLTLSEVTLDNVTLSDSAGGSFVNADTLTIDGTVTLNGATISGGTIDDNSTASGIVVTGASTIESATIDGSGAPGVGLGGLGGMGGAGGLVLAGSGDITANGATLTLSEVTLDNVTLSDSAGGSFVNADTLTIDGTVTLNGATISGGTIDDNSTASGIVVEAASAIKNATINGSGAGAGGAAGSGDIAVNGATLTLSEVTLDGVTLSDSDGGSFVNADTLTIEGTVTLNGATINGGTIDDNSTISGIVVTGASTIENATINGSAAGGVGGPGGFGGLGGAGGLTDITSGNIAVSGTTLTFSTVTLDTVTLSDSAGGSFVNTDTLTIEGTVTLNGATISGGTINDFTSDPSGSIVAGDIDVTKDSTISAALNKGNVTIEANQTLTLDGSTITGASFDDTASGAVIQVDGGDTLTLNNVSINGGTINAFTSVPSGAAIAADIDVTGSSTISNAALNNGKVTLGGNVQLTLDGTTVTGTSFDDTAGGATIRVDGGDTLTLNGANFDGGVIDAFTSVPSGSVIAGDIDVTGSSGISNATLNNGHVTIGAGIHLGFDNATVIGASFDDVAAGATIDTAGTLTLNDVSINGGTIHNFSTDGGGHEIANTIDVTGSSTISNAALNGGDVTLGGNVTLNLDGATVTGTSFDDTASGAVIQIDGGDTLTLNGVTIHGGAINDFSTGPSGSIVAGDIDVTGDSTISNAALNHGNVTLGNNVMLTLDGSTVTGTSFSDTASGAVIQVDGAAGDTVHLNGISVDGGGLTVAAHGLVQTSGTVTLTDTTVTNDGTIEVTGGTLTITGAGSVADSAGNTGGTIQIDGGATLDLQVSDTENVSFSGSGGELQIDTSSFGGSISGLFAGDQIDLATIGYGPDTTASYSGGILTVTDGTHSIELNLVGDYSGAHFAGSADGNGTLITLNANDDLPIVAAADGSFAETPHLTGANNTTDHATGTVTFTDVDLTDRPTVTATFASYVYKDAAGHDLSLAEQAAVTALETNLSFLADTGNTNNGSVGWTYSITDSALDFMAAGDKLILTYTASVNDNAGGIVTAPINVTITGSDDAPAISGSTSGAVADGGVTVASGTLTAADPDRGDTVSWNVVGGTSVASENYDYGLHQFEVTVGSTTIFDNGPNFLSGTTPSGGALFATGTFASGSSGPVQLDGTNAVPAGVSLGTGTYGDLVLGQYATLLTATSFDTRSNNALSSDEAFSASARFSLIDPVDGQTRYGVRLTDHVSGSTGGAFDQPGTETVDLSVVHDADGTIGVQLTEIDFETGIRTILQTIELATNQTQGITDNQILLSLSNDPASNGHITASYQLMGTNSDGTEVADGGPVSFTATGQIFDNENWTRAQVYGQSVATSDTAPADVTANAVSVEQGTYGTLDINEQTGAWQYFLNPGLASVKALAAGQTATDSFTIQATDSSSEFTTKVVNVTVTGIDDAPTVGFSPAGAVSTAENHAVTIGGITVNDVDAGSSQIEVTIAAGHGALSLQSSAGLDSVHSNSDGSINLFGSQAEINAALAHGVVYTPATDFSGADTLTVTANDQVSSALGGPLTGTEQITVNVEPGTPVFSSMTLTIAQGATDVLTDANFVVTDPDTSHFLYTASHVTGGQFEVSDGTNWTAATSFTTAQVEAAHVEFVQDGTDTAPNFSIDAADGVNHSATIAPTVTFTPTPPVAHDDVLAAGPSGSGWVLDTDNGHYYREVAVDGSFDTAVTGAAADGGYLATITSAAEESFVVNHVINGFGATWLGGETTTDRPDGSTVNQSTWFWITGPEANTQFTYTNWHTGEPSGGFGATTEWLQINADGTWNDAPDVGQLGDGAGAGYLEEWGGTPQQITFLENTGTAVATSVLLANDTDVNGLPLTVTAVGDGTGHTEHGGTVSLSDGTVTYTPSADYSGADSFSYTISDGNGTSTATVSFDVVPGTPVFDSMTLTVAQGGVDLLTDANFAITDPLTSHFTYTVDNVSGGQFEVSNGSSWTTATSFTTAQVEAGHVEFVQDGSATAPNFSIVAADGVNHSAAVAPTVDFEATHALAPANLIVNGGFETYDYTGWTIGGTVATSDSLVVGPYHEDFRNDAPHTGSHEALVGSQPEEMTLSQIVATTAGAHYTVDFWVMQDQPPLGGDDFSANWNGTTLTSLVNVGQQSGYTEYQFDVTGAAGSGSSTLEFSANNIGYWDIDDVSVLKGAPTAVQEMSDATTKVTGVSATDTLTVTPPANAIGSVSATAGNGTVEWQFQATNAQLDHLMGLTQSFTVTDSHNAAVSQTLAVSVGGNGNDQFVFHAGVGADTMVNFSMLTTAQGAYAGDTIELANFTGITSPSDVLTHLAADSHGNAVVDLGNHDSITFQGLSVAQIQANASHIFQV